MVAAEDTAVVAAAAAAVMSVLSADGQATGPGSALQVILADPSLTVIQMTDMIVTMGLKIGMIDMVASTVIPLQMVMEKKRVMEGTQVGMALVEVDPVGTREQAAIVTETGLAHMTALAVAAGLVAALVVVIEKGQARMIGLAGVRGLLLLMIATEEKEKIQLVSFPVTTEHNMGKLLVPSYCSLFLCCLETWKVI